MQQVRLPTILLALATAASGCSLDRAPQDHRLGSSLSAATGDATTDSGSQGAGGSPAADGSGAGGANRGGDGDGDRNSANGDTDGQTQADAGTGAPDIVVDPPPVIIERYAGACGEDRDCEADEICVSSQDLTGRASYCAAACQSNADCAPGPAGANAATCGQSAQGVNRCHLPCDVLLSNSCPATMNCRDTLLFLSNGACAFPD